MHVKFCSVRGVDADLMRISVSCEIVYKNSHIMHHASYFYTFYGINLYRFYQNAALRQHDHTKCDRKSSSKTAGSIPGSKIMYSERRLTYS